MKQFSESLKEKRVAIIGLGLMGGSMAMALRNKCARLMGVDLDDAALSFAVGENILDQASTRAEEILPDADLVIISTPVHAIISILAELPKLIPDGAAVIDLGSTKSSIVFAMNGLPVVFEAVGGHPICGKETYSIFNADPHLYRGSTFVLSPSLRTTTRARTLAEQIVAAVDGIPLWMDPGVHDRLMASTSHFPYLLSNALAHSIPREAFPLAGPGLQSSVRLAGSPIEMMMDILNSNRENVLDALKSFMGTLNELEVLLNSAELEELEIFLDRGRENYCQFVGEAD